MNPYRKDPREPEATPERVDRGATYRAARRRLALSAAALVTAALLLPFFARACKPKHTQLVPPELLDAGATFPAVPPDLPPAVPLEPLLVADAPDRLAVIEPTETALDVRPGDPIVVRFNRPMVSGAEVGHPLETGPLTFSPPIHGRTTWTSRGTLSFEASPRAWDGTHTATLGLSDELRSLAGESVSDAFEHTVVFDDGPRLAGRPKESRLLPGEPIRLAFTGKVDEGALGSELMIYEVDGGRRMLPFTARAKKRDEKGQTPIELALGTVLEPGAHLAVAIAPPLSQGGAEPRVIELELSPRPQIEGIDCPEDAKAATDCKLTEAPGAIVDIDDALRLLSSEPLADLAPGSVEVTPALEGLVVVIEDSKKLAVKGNWTPGQVYQVRVKTLRDRDGHELLRTPPLAVRSAGRPPEVKFATGRLTLEHDATPRLPLEAIHIDDGVVRLQGIPAGGEFDAIVHPEAFFAPDSAKRYSEVPLQGLLPRARPNRWATGWLPWRELAPDASSMLLVSLLADKASSGAPPTFLQSTDLGLDAKLLPRGVLVWATSIERAKPVEGATITIADATGFPLALASTDASGVVWFPIFAGASLKDGVIVRATRGDDRAVMVVDPRTSMGPRHLGMVPGEAPPEIATKVATVFTDRGIVRPGESLHAKAIVRSVTQGDLVAPSGEATLKLFGPRGEAPIAERSLLLSPFGTLSADFTLGAGAEEGEYRVEAGVTGQSTRAGETTFTVGQYRPPTFRVDLTSNAEDLSEHDDLSVGVSAAYLFGPPARGRSAHWSITRESGSDPESFADYTFSPVDSSVRTGTMGSGDLELDASGHATLSSKVDIGVSARADAVVEVTVNDVSGLSTSTRRTIHLHPASYEVGVHDVPAWLEAGTTLDVDTLVVGHDGAPVPGRTIEARILREGWHTYWEWSAHDNGDDEATPDGAFQARRAHRSDIVHRCKLTSGDAPVHCTFDPKRPGTYVLEAVTRDEKGRTSTASTRVYVAGPDEHPDRDAPGGRLALTAEKDSLLVGDMAQIAFESPFPEAEALLEVERDGVLVHEVRHVSAGGNVFRFPVTAEMIPNAFVSLSLVRPRTGAPGDKLDLDAPDLRVGLTELSVKPSTSPLTVSIDTTAWADAGGDVAVDVAVTDAAGEPVLAEVALFAVDEGTLRVTGFETPDALLGLFPRMAPAFAWEDLRRSLVSRVTDPLLPGAGGDGSDGSAKLAPEELDRFEPTPLWAPHVVTDASGHASAELHLPERPTQYRIMAVATDTGIRAGRAERTIVATKPLVVRAVVPEVATVGDRFTAVAFIHNTEDVPIDVSVTPDVAGTARAPVSVHIEPKGEARVEAVVDIERPEDLSIRFEARSERGESESESNIHVLPRGRVVAASSVGAVKGSRTISLTVPEGEVRTLSLAIGSHPFVGFDTALDALLASPDAGVEATASSVLGLAAYASLDLDRRPSSVSPRELEARADAAIGRLVALQGTSGGFGAFDARDMPDDYLTAFALHALSKARHAGFSVDVAVRERATRYLETRVRGNSFLDGHDDGSGHDALAFALRVLAEEGATDAERNGALFAQRERLSPYGLSELALAMAPDDMRRLTLIVDAETRVLATRDDERKDPAVLRWYDSSARTLGAVLEAVSSTDTLPEVTPRVASRLLRTRSGDSAAWWSSHETSQALSALASYAATFQSEEPLLAKVKLDGETLSGLTSSNGLFAIAVPPRLVGAGKHELTIETSDVAWFALEGSWFVPLGEADEIARGKAAALHRTFEDAAGKPLASGAHVHLGDLVRVRLFLYSEEPAPPYVVVRDRLAGGLEPLDEGHETTPRDSLSALLGMGPDDDVVDVRAHYASRSLDIISHRAFRKEAAVFYLADAGAGLHELTYGVRAVTAGVFVLPPAEANALYARGFTARSEMATFTVDP